MQKRSHSLIEASTSTSAGFLISLAAWEFVVKPVWGLPTTFAENFAITLFFTVISVARSYVFRRIFNWHAARDVEAARG